MIFTSGPRLAALTNLPLRRGFQWIIPVFLLWTYAPRTSPTSPTTGETGSHLAWIIPQWLHRFTPVMSQWCLWTHGPPQKSPFLITRVVRCGKGRTYDVVRWSLGTSFAEPAATSAKLGTQLFRNNSWSQGQFPGPQPHNQKLGLF